MTPSVPPPFRAGPSSGTVLPEYAGLGFANIAPTVLGHFGMPSALPPLSADALPRRLLAGAERVVTLLIDALGADRLSGAMERGVVPRLRALVDRPSAHLSVLASTFPSTTVTALTTLGTGLAPGDHGVVSHSLYDASLGTVVDVLRFAPALAGGPLEGAGVEPAAWIGLPTVSERLRAAGVATTIVNHAEHETTPLARIAGRGATFVGFQTVSDFCANLRAAIEAATAPAHVHAYWGGLDAIAHAYGVASAQFQAELRVLDHALGEVLLGGLSAPETLLLVFADHGQIDARPESRVWLNDHPALLAMLSAPPAGLWRAVILYVRPGREGEAHDYAERHLGAHADVLTAEEAERLGLYGPGAPTETARQRAGQLLLLPREGWLIEHHHRGQDRTPVATIGQHGGLSAQEMLVPLLAVRLE